jgi:hypothetical protein
MNLDELIEYLQNLRTDMPGSTLVMLATQPSWPFEQCIGELVTATNADGERAVFLAEGHESSYLSEEVREVLGW